MPDLGAMPQKSHTPDPFFIPVSDHDCAYAAGLFDGEGCVQIVRTPAHKRVRHKEAGLGLTANVVNTDRPVLEWLQERWGGNLQRKVISPGTLTRVRPDYWILHGKRAGYFLTCIQPYSKIKLRQIEAVLLFAETYFRDWRHMGEPGWRLTDEARHLRRMAFRGFRTAMDSQTGRGLSWGI